jgi:hypothetical protein
MGGGEHIFGHNANKTNEHLKLMGKYVRQTTQFITKT